VRVPLVGSLFFQRFHLIHSLPPVTNRRGYSGVAIYRKHDLHRNYVGSLERGKRNVSLLTIVKLAHP
jgi:hypothetical protein